MRFSTEGDILTRVMGQLELQASNPVVEEEVVVGQEDETDWIEEE